MCTFKFGSWSYSGLQVDLVNRSTEVDFSNYVESGEWELRAIIVERLVLWIFFSIIALRVILILKENLIQN